MAKTRFITGERRDIFLYSTRVENLFINEFLPGAPGDCVKVFLFGLMYAQYNQEIDSRTMALTLGLTEKDVDNAWKYWESKGLVRLSPSAEDSGTYVEFIRQIEQFYGKSYEEPAAPPDTSESTEESAEDIIERVVSQQLRAIYLKYQDLTGRTISRVEAGKLEDAIKTFNVEPDVLDFAIDYCTGIDKYSVDYICKVALRWTEDGARDVSTVKQMIDRRSKRNDAYRKVFAELGFNRLPNPSDREIMDRWFDEMGCSLADVLDACRAAGGMREPHLRYVNKVIENRILEKGGVNTRAADPSRGRSQAEYVTQPPAAEEAAKVSRKVLKDYYDYIRKEEEDAFRARVAEAAEAIPALEDIFTREAGLNSAVVTMRPGPDSREKRQQLKEKRMELEERKKELLTHNGYPADYLERKYRCRICRDTGYTDEGRVCTCAKERAEEAYKWIQKRNQ